MAGDDRSDPSRADDRGGHDRNLLEVTLLAGYKRETSSATMAAAGCGCVASATLCPAHNESASTSPVVPTIGAAVSYRTMASPSAKCAMTSPSPGRLPS